MQCGGPTKVFIVWRNTLGLQHGEPWIEQCIKTTKNLAPNCTTLKLMGYTKMGKLGTWNEHCVMVTIRAQKTCSIMRQKMHKRAYAMVVSGLSIWYLTSLFEVLQWRCSKWYKWSRKWELQEATWPIFVGVPHQIEVSNYGNVIIPIDMLKLKWTWCSNWQDTQ